jgi:hypothetical protein
MAAAGVALAVLFLGVGVLIGRSGSGAEQTAAKPTIVRGGRRHGLVRDVRHRPAGLEHRP